jgi:hypothetical protein
LVEAKKSTQLPNFAKDVLQVSLDYVASYVALQFTVYSKLGKWC